VTAFFAFRSSFVNRGIAALHAACCAQPFP